MNYFRGTPEQRFWRYVNKTETCWLWTASVRSREGYGNFWNGSKIVLVHRWSWEHFHKTNIPEGMLVCHHCDTPNCVRPDHLFIGTDADNIADRDRKGRRIWGKGVDHWINKNPEARRKFIENHTGDRNWMRKHPERFSGELNYAAKLTYRQVEEIRRRYAEGGITQLALAQEYGVKQPVISKIILNLAWKYIPNHSDATNP